MSALRPAAGVRPRRWRVVAEIGREHHGALEQVLDRRGRHAQRKAAARGMSDQRHRRHRHDLAQKRREIGQIVLELADIADIAAGAGGAVAAQIHREAFHAARGEPLRQRVDGAAAGAGRAVDHDRRRARSAVPPAPIVAEAEPFAVAGLESLDRRQAGEIDRAAGRGDRLQLRRRCSGVAISTVSNTARPPTADRAHLTVFTEANISDFNMDVSHRLDLM